MAPDPTPIVFNLISAAIGFLASRTWSLLRSMRRRRGQGALLARVKAPCLFVFPHREMRDTNTIIPPTATEDFMAIINVKSALGQVGQTADFAVRDPSRLSDTERKQNNLILIGSSKRNKVTEEALDLLRGRLGDLAPVFENAGDGRIRIRFDGGIWESKSYESQGPELVDVALIMKVKSPWSEDRQVLIVAGVRGFGTWGAAEALNKSWWPIYERKASIFGRKIRKTGDFAAIVCVHYKDCDIKIVHPLIVIDLDQPFDETRVARHLKQLEPQTINY